VLPPLEAPHPADFRAKTGEEFRVSATGDFIQSPDPPKPETLEMSANAAAAAAQAAANVPAAAEATYLAE
jgi:hypothetical protein